jgi:hypothetical protein
MEVKQGEEFSLFEKREKALNGSFSLRNFEF